VTFKGRYLAAAWLLAALATLWVVAARQTAAFRDAGALRDARAARARLEGRRAELERRIRSAQSRAVLVPRAEDRLRLRLPADSEIILLPVPAAPAR
jgi:hypothetical protein